MLLAVLAGHAAAADLGAAGGVVGQGADPLVRLDTSPIAPWARNWLTKINN